jgi:hypothetical protein
MNQKQLFLDCQSQLIAELKLPFAIRNRFTVIFKMSRQKKRHYFIKNKSSIENSPINRTTRFDDSLDLNKTKSCIFLLLIIF